MPTAMAAGAIHVAFGENVSEGALPLAGPIKDVKNRLDTVEKALGGDFRPCGP
jgi:hypothetical protein